ncbi:MAG TPA: ABC transporter permease, partial [Ferruginibacter sp.]|nr:ABC transporter permease [Ferruginibacter sp.]
MNKIILIIKREFLTRVRKRTFIIGTILFPLLYLGLIFGTGYIADKSKEDLSVAVIDKSGYFTEAALAKLNQDDTLNKLTLVNVPEDILRDRYDSLGYNGYVVIPATLDWRKGLDSLSFNTNKTYGIGATVPVERKLNRLWDEIKNDSLGIDAGKKTILATSKINLKILNIKNRAADSQSATIIGYVCGFLMYLILLLYGSQVMMGVTEEKTNRIAEVVVSSVKPFQLMVGKIIGIGMVALTQFLIWIACIFIIYNAGRFGGQQGGMLTNTVESIQRVFTSVNILLVVCCFIFYMLAGFFFYSSLYAAIGSAINEDMREAQS